MDNIDKLPVGKSDKVFYAVITIILLLLALIVLYPMYFMVIASVSDPDALMNGDVFLLPKDITFSGYQHLINEKLIWTGYKNTILYTLSGTILNIMLTIPAGWALSRKGLPFKRFFMLMFLITMFFGGGLMPFYLTVQRLGMVGSPLSVIIPGSVSVWNLFMCRSFFEGSIPQELIEASEVDGSGHFRTFVLIILPVSKALIAVMVLFYAVGHWNSYFNAMIFLSDKKYFPLQLVLKDILTAAESTSSTASAETILEQTKLANQIKYTSIIVSSLPMILFYPFVQKHFSSGIMVGSLKS